MPAAFARYDLTGRTALVTGAGGLLGRQHVAALVDAGARVVVSDIGMAQADSGGQSGESLVARGRSRCGRDRRDVASFSRRRRR